MEVCTAWSDPERTRLTHPRHAAAPAPALARRAYTLQRSPTSRGAVSASGSRAASLAPVGARARA